MNGRPRWPWVVFVVGLLPVIAALAYVSIGVLRLERREAQAGAAAAFEESARAALWRMDSAMAPIIARESSRPYFHYQPFYPADRAYTSMWEEVRAGEVLVASPLLTVDDPHILLYFQRGQHGDMTSPQAPTGNMRDLAESSYTTSQSVIDGERRLGELAALLTTAATMLAELPEPGSAEPLAPVARLSPQTVNIPGQVAQQQMQAIVEEQAQTDYAAREQINRLARNQGPAGQRWIQPTDGLTPGALAPAPATPEGGSGGLAAKSAAPRPIDVVQGDTTALWISREPGDEPILLIARRVRGGSAELIQGAWLDWPTLRNWLLTQASDVLPQGAALAPVVAGSDLSQSPGRRLAAIPAALVLPSTPAAALPRWTPMRTTLALSWLAVLAAAIAAGLALRSAADLADRRGRFVSAVTHELRTPLTTFCLYTQMLDDGMVRDESSQREYIGTLRRESRRLARIVENVLEFARLGRTTGAHPSSPPIAIGELLDRITPVLAARAKEGGLEFIVDSTLSAPGLGVRLTTADPYAVEQVLLNLVENACKYAAAGGRVELTVHQDRGQIALTITDHGPGIAPAEARRLFRPFQRGASLAHASTPGLGLGLAVSRGLARQSGGELTLTRSSPEGCSFTLLLPCPPSPTDATAGPS